MGAGHLGMRLVERFGVGKLGTTNGTKDTNGGAVEGWRDGGTGAGHLGMRLVERFGVGKLGTTNGTKGTNGGRGALNVE
jgi:hypothetical protein